MFCRVWQRVFVLLTVFISVPYAAANLLNVTFDDSATGDDRGASISYTPAGSWQDAAHCTGEYVFLCDLNFSDSSMPGCFAKPDINTVYLGTYHHTTQDTLIDTQPTFFTFDFTGA
jgi:hypothetical protein